jgi:hypothetical protein
LLQLVAAREQLRDAAGEALVEAGQRFPEAVGVEVEPGEELVGDERAQGRVDVQGSHGVILTYG